MKLNAVEVCQSIEDFLAGRGEARDWDDFISIPIEDSELNNIRLICAKLPDSHPPATKTEYCNEQGQKVLRELVDKLHRIEQKVRPISSN
jgi:hypothetical protein